MTRGNCKSVDYLLSGSGEVPGLLEVGCFFPEGTSHEAHITNILARSIQEAKLDVSHCYVSVQVDRSQEVRDFNTDDLSNHVVSALLRARSRGGGFESSDARPSFQAVYDPNLQMPYPLSVSVAREPDSKKLLATLDEADIKWRDTVKWLQLGGPHRALLLLIAKSYSTRLEQALSVALNRWAGNSAPAVEVYVLGCADAFAPGVHQLGPKSPHKASGLFRPDEWTKRKAWFYDRVDDLFRLSAEKIRR